MKSPFRDATLSAPRLLLALGLSLTPMTAFAQNSPAPYTSWYRYDLDHRIVGSIAPDPDGVGPHGFPVVRNSYDAAGQLSKTERGELAAWQAETVIPASWSGFTIFQTADMSYDLDGRKIRQVTSSGGIATALMQWSYDAFGRVICTAIRMNSANSFASAPTDACALGAAGPTGPDRLTRNLYDAAGQLVQVRRAVGTSLEEAYATYAYSLNGKQTAVVDANGNRAELQYDGFDRQSRWVFPVPAALSETARQVFTAATPADALAASGAANANDYEEYGYDANGNRTSLRKRDGSVLGFDYDALNRVTRKTVPTRTGTPTWATRSVYYGYDLLGHQLYARYDGGDDRNEGVTNAYDGLGRLTSSTQLMDGVSRPLSYQYDADGNRTQLTYPDGQSFSYDYDGLDRMGHAYAGTSPSGTAIASLTYNAAGLRDGLTGAQADSTSYVYDGAQRLQTLSHGFAGGTGNVATTFGYNPASQITSEQRSNTAYAWTGNYNVDRSYAANGLNQYSSAGPATFTYDANGNLLSGAGITYGYDVENKLIGASGSRTATLKYDPLGRLYETSDAGAGITRFLYDGDALIGEYNASGTMLRRYVHGPGADEPLVWYEGGDLYAPRWLHADHQGSIVAVTTSGGALLRTNTYDPYGIPANANLGRFLYTGQIWIPELGIYHYKARAYSPTLGRFLQTDPIGYKDQVNLYAYGANDPVNGRDPSGNSTVYRYPDGTVVVVQTFDNQTAGKTNVPITDASIAAQGDKFSGRTNGHYMSVVLQPGNDVDTVHIKVDPSRNEQGDNRSNSDLGGREVRLAPNAFGPITAGHELGHSMKAGDLYAGGGGADGKPVPSDVPGTAGTIMRDYGGLPAAQQTRDEIYRGLNDQMNTQKSCSVTVFTTECK